MGISVLLIGVGADRNNVGENPPVLDDGRFAYVPVPEKKRNAVSEDPPTFGDMATDLYPQSTPQDLAEPLFEVVDDQIQPDEGERIPNDAVPSYPVHHDPNFHKLSFGEATRMDDHFASGVREHDTYPNFGAGDIVAFYSGLTRESSVDGRDTHRYLIGYFTLKHDPFYLGNPSEELDRETTVSDKSERLRLLRDHNPAHYYRAKANGDIYSMDPPLPEYEDREGMLLFVGKQPGGLLDRAVQISRPSNFSDYDKGNYGTTTDLEEILGFDEEQYLGGRKPIYLKDNINCEAFLEFIQSGPNWPITNRD